jgi:hypothetical protein
VRDPPAPPARGGPLEHLPDDGRLGRVHPALDVAVDADVVVAEHDAARDVPRPSAPQQGVMGPLARLVPFDLGGEVFHRQDDLVRRGGERDHAAVRSPALDDLDARADQLFQDIARLDLLPPDAIAVRDQQRLERGPRFERAHQPEEAGPAGELGTRDPVVLVDMGGVHRPALARGVGPGLLDLPRDGLGLLGDAGLVGGLAGVDGSGQNGPAQAGGCRC